MSNNALLQRQLIVINLVFWSSIYCFFYLHRQAIIAFEEEEEDQWMKKKVTNSHRPRCSLRRNLHIST